MKRLLFLLLFFWFSIHTFFAQNFPVGHIETHYFDAARSNRDVWTEIYYPATVAGNNTAVATGTFPVIVFGHGFTITWSSYDYFWNYFVPKGYICVFPRTEGNLSPNHGNFGGDLAYLSQLFPNVLNADAASPFYQKVAPKTAIMGHSMGGGASFLGCANNSQVTTMVTYAAAVTNPSSVTAAANVTCPTLVIAGKEDCVAPIADHQRLMYNGVSNAACKYYVELSGASHCQFTNGNATTCYFGEGTACIGWGPFISLQDQQMRTLALTENWLKYYLKNDCSGWSNFESYIDAESASGNIDSVMQACNNSVPIATVTPVGPLTFCDGGSATLTASGGNTYSWSTGATGSMLTVTAAGNYTAYVTQGICTVASTPVTVNVHPLPATPIVSQIGNVLSCGNIPGGVTANWSVNGQNVATGPFYNPPVGSGSVIVTFTDANGCIATSAPFSYTISSLYTSHFEGFVSIAPNPVQDFLEIQLSPATPDLFTFQLQDVTGKNIFVSTDYVSVNYRKMIDFRSLPQGIYFLHISNTTQTMTSKISNHF